LKRKNLYLFSLVSGILTLSVGVGIFLLWWMARAWFAIQLSILEHYGVIWLIVSLPIALIGLSASVVVIASNSNLYLRRTFVPLIIILLNIPAVYIVLSLQSEIAERAYFKLQNESGHDLTDLKITSKSFNKEIGSLKVGASLVDYYLPKYLSHPGESVPQIEELTLEFTLGESVHIQPIPYCTRIKIDKNLKLEKIHLKNRKMLFFHQHESDPMGQQFLTTSFGKPPSH